MDKPKVLLLGGCGFIGRNLTSYLVSNDLVSHIRIVDKVPPQVAWLNNVHQILFSSPVVEFKSANLINSDSCKNAFDIDVTWDFVINCAGETKPSLTDPIYNEGILKLSINCAKEAAQHNVKHYIELSSGNMYSCEKVPHKEDGTVKPWTSIAKWKREVEEQIGEIPNFKYTILRLPIVYGSGDRNSIMKRVIVAAIYRHMGETMKLLWNSDVKINTVHIIDVCRAVWFVANREDTIGEIYNVVDDADSTQGTISELISDLFDMKIEYYGNIVSAIVDLAHAADQANDKHLTPWAEACRHDEILNTPLSPHMDPEVLVHKHINLDGSKLKSIGFQLEVPKPTIKSIKDVLDEYVSMKVFPLSLAP